MPQPQQWHILAIGYSCDYLHNQKSLEYNAMEIVKSRRLLLFQYIPHLTPVLNVLELYLVSQLGYSKQ